jgi:hypothetical protein
LEAASQSTRPYEPKASKFYQIPVFPSGGKIFFHVEFFFKELVAEVGDEIFPGAFSPYVHNGALAATNEVCALRTSYVVLYSASPIYQTRIGVKRGCLMHHASPATSEKNFCLGYCILYWFGNYFISDPNILVLLTKRSTELLPHLDQLLPNGCYMYHKV